nr:tigger transposable element-derived protein 6-like [Procambarus clarkii]XP_045583729.1 tigger transposable element-derived protein 6-like [Procambarus clarkii]XP_045583738.1 tigger transposable element-derived protein 6-like [Procambarus clarkii]XP_045583746.1 tigger transposable element-derived protein 6-like [Procambarus clarkii]
MDAQAYGNMPMELLPETSEIQHMTRPEAVTQTLNTVSQVQAVVQKDSEVHLSLEMNEEQEDDGGADDDDNDEKPLQVVEHPKKKNTRRCRTKIKKKERAKRAVPHGDSQVGNAFTFMRKRRQDLTLGAKVKVLEMLDLEPKVPQGKIASMFRVSQSQVSRIMKNKEAIMSQWNRFATPERKRCRLGKAGFLEQKLVDWYKEAVEEDLPISGPILMEKAKSIGNEMGIEFKPSAGWLGRWKDRNGVTLKRFKDKDGAPSGIKIGNHWRRYMFSKTTKEYPLQNVWVVDETPLAYNALPEYMTQGTNSGNDKVSVILACNLAGTERRPAVVIGRAQLLSSLTLPTPFHHHPKAAITLEFFSSWLREWDRELRSKRRKIIILLNKATYHPENLHLFNINISLFPPGTATVLQPLRLGVIYIFKALYRHQQVKHIMAKTHANEQMNHTNMFNQNILSPPSLTQCVSTLDAIFMIYKAWRHVSPETIVKGVVKAGLSKDVDALNVNDQISPPPGISQQDFDAFVSSDEGLNCDEHEEAPTQNLSSHTGMVTNIVQYPHYSNMFNIPNNKSQQPNQQSDPQVENAPSPPKVCEAVIACQVLRHYLQQQGGRLFDEFSELESAIHLDMILEMRPDFRNDFQSDPLHDSGSVHSLEAHQVAHEQKLYYIQKVQDELQQQKIQRQIKKAALSSASSQNSHSTLATPTQGVRTDVPNQLLEIQRHDIHAQEIVRHDMVRQELQQPMHRQELVRQDARPEYRHVIPQDIPRPDVSELRALRISNYRHVNPDGRNEDRNEIKSDTMTITADLHNHHTTNHHPGVELHHQGIPPDMSQSLRPPDARLENHGIPYYTIPNTLHHYIQPK